jgi:hypothetical protein
VSITADGTISSLVVKRSGASGNESTKGSAAFSS